MNKIDTANKSQRIVAEMLRDKGFELAEVNHPSANGVDIVAIKNNKYFNIEVKTASYSQRSWRVGRPNIDSDYIAVVMPSGYVHFDYLSDWLKVCSKDGSRRITSLVRFYDEL